MDPIGPASVLPAILVLFLVCLSHGSLPLVARDSVSFAAPVILFLAVGISPGSLFGGRTFPGLEEFLGYYILIAFGVGFGLRLLRRATFSGTVSGCISVLVFGSLITIDFVLKSHRSWNLYYGGTELGTPIIGALLIFIPICSLSLLYLSNGYIQQRRGRRGVCPLCEYDLRGNPSACSCPECGVNLTTRMIPEHNN